MRLWESISLCTGLSGETTDRLWIDKDKILFFSRVLGFVSDLLYHFQVKPAFAIIMVIILDEVFHSEGTM